MQFSRSQYQTIALAAVTQSAMLVDALAETGRANADDMAACVQPLLVLDPQSVAEVYPSVNAFGSGLRILQEIFSNQKAERNNEIARYVLGMLVLRSRLMANETMQKTLRRELKSLKIAAPVEADPDHIEHAYSQLAALYQQTISHFSFRIHVKGRVEFLKDESIANRIRALLLTGIRSAVLWYQLGGRRWHLLVYRNRIRESVVDIRRSLLTSV